MSRELVKTAVVTGGHSFDVIAFTRLFRNMDGIQAYIQHIDDFSASKQDVRDSYDVVLLYIFMQEQPRDEGHPWWVGKPKTALEHLGKSGQGLVVLHHALLAYRGWSLWNDLVGVQDRGFGYYKRQQLHIKVADTQHPITQGLQDWDMVDETYTMSDAESGNHILLTTTHPRSMRTLAWTRQYINARVFYLESGHNSEAFVNSNFQQVLTQGIWWTAGKI